MPFSAEVLPQGLQTLQAEQFHYSSTTTSIHFSVLSLGQTISQFKLPLTKSKAGIIHKSGTCARTVPVHSPGSSL